MENTKLGKFYIKVIVKLIVVLFWALTVWGLISVIADDLVSANNDKWNDAEYINQCDRYYYKKEYGNLRDLLVLYDLYNEKYDVYWEVVDGYEDYNEWKQWESARDNGLENCDEKIEHYKRKIVTNAASCKFKKNSRQLNAYAEKVGD